MDEITSIAYNIGKDPAFYYEHVTNTPSSTSDMAKALSRYLVGNNFIEHLAFCRTAEPNTIYTPNGSRSLSEFMSSGLGVNRAYASEMIQQIHDQTETKLTVISDGSSSYITYCYPLPQLSAKPQAHVLMIIPATEVRPLFETLYLNASGSVSVFDMNADEIFSISNLNDEIDLSEFVRNGGAEENFTSASGNEYVLQKAVSESNGWTFVSVIRHSDTLSGLANKQLVFIALILLLLVIAIAVMLVSVISQYKPISNLAAQVADVKPAGAAADERAFLSETIAELRGDSEQKRKYETAFYEAEAASKAKSAFLSSMSHDIRTPMNAIVGMTAIARKHIGDAKYVDECLQKVQTSSDYLLDIINNVLDMSRIESGRIPISEEPLLIPVLIDSVVSLMTSAVDAKGQTLSVDMSGLKRPAVLGDGVHIVQVFVNILSNAVKFTPEGGKLSIGVSQSESGDETRGKYVFTFTDTGIGIAPEFISHVFDTFTRADDPSTSRTEGTGLGMAIAKKLADLMGGDIKCESELGAGTTFTVTLLMKYADDSAAAALLNEPERPRSNRSGGETEAPDLSGRRILLVEDNAMNREIAYRIISETRAEIISARDGSEAVGIFGESPSGHFDLIFMDIQMPVMNGYEATSAIRSMDRPDAKTVPIYAMTANTFDSDVRQVKSAGMNGHIGKPYNPAALYRVLAKALK